MAAPTMGSFLIEECGTCKSPTKEMNRSLCATCLNRNLQRACESIVVLKVPSPQQSFCRGPAPRALFPGMPRAVLCPMNSEKGHQARPLPPCGTSKTTSAGNSPVPFFGVRTPDIKEADPPSLRDASKGSLSQKIELTRETTGEARALTNGDAERNEFGPEMNLAGEKKAEHKGEDKWHLFQIEKNLTVRIPNPPIDILARQPRRCQPLVAPLKVNSDYSFPTRKESRTRQGLRPDVKRSSIKPNVNAEAELMMRLLADSIPILKSTGPLVLPPCEVRPVSPVSPPGDPLWKRRSITCPKSLKVQVSSICVS